MRKLDNVHARRDFVRFELSKLRSGVRLLDAGAGSQRFRQFCEHLEYQSQDFAAYTKDEMPTLSRAGGSGGASGYSYGETDYICDICDIPCPNEEFDAVLCTEVLEHLPYPWLAIKEISRIIKPGGKLILTVPSNCLRHMDPYFFFSGFSDHWIRRILSDNGFEVEFIEHVGGYYSWLFVEICRVMRFNLFAAPLLIISAIYFLLKKDDKRSIATLCMGYHVVAVKVVKGVTGGC